MVGRKLRVGEKSAGNEQHRTNKRLSALYPQSVQRNWVAAEPRF